MKDTFGFFPILGSALLAFASIVKAEGYLGPTTDFGFPDSPQFSYLYLEDFEDGSLNTLGVQSSSGSVLAGALVDSVELGGRSFYPNSTSVRFIFDRAVLGHLPTHVGFVWTDVGDVLGGTTGFGQVQLEAFGPTGASLGVHGPFDVGDGLFAGQIAEDRFLGVVSLTGISSITISMPNSSDWEMDHLQYGATVIPIPAGIWLLGSGLAGLLATRRRSSGSSE